MKQERQNILRGIMLVRQRQFEVEAQIRRLEELLEAASLGNAAESEPASDADASPLSGERLMEAELELNQLREQLKLLRQQLEDLEQDADDDILYPPPRKHRQAKQEVQYKGFLSGLVLAWFVVSLGAFAVLLSWKMLTWSADLLNLSVPVLVSFLLLFALSLLLQAKAKDIVDWILNLTRIPFDDEEDDYDI